MLLLLILLQLFVLDKTANAGPCSLTFDFAIKRTVDDPGAQSEVRPYYLVYKSDGTYIIESTWKGRDPGTGYINIQNNLGSCNPSDRNALQLPRIEKTLSNCGKDILIYSTGMEIDDTSADDEMWNYRAQFKCDGKPFRKVACGDEGGSDVNITCTNEYSLDKLLPPFLQMLGNSLDTDSYDNDYYQKYMELLDKLRQADLNYGAEMDQCQNEKSWDKYESCKVFFLQPVIALVASFSSKDLPNQEKINAWTTKEFAAHQAWAKVPGDGWINQIFKVLNKTMVKKSDINGNFFLREMIYTHLHRVNPDVFNWDESPMSKLAEIWYQYAKESDDQNLQKILQYKMPQRVFNFCEEYRNKEQSPLCSFVAAKSKYDDTLRYLPQKNSTTAISIYANYGEKIYYDSLQENLERFLDKTDIKDAINTLSNSLSKYFRTLANFDNQIAQADVGYIKSAIEKNTNQLSDNTKRMDELVVDIRKDSKVCMMLNFFETMLTLVVNIGVCVATGGAVPPNLGAINSAVTGAKTAAKMGELITDATNKMALFTDAVGKIRDSIKTVVEADRTALAVQMSQRAASLEDGLKGIIKGLENNKESIERMHRITEAVMSRSSLDVIKNDVDRFLQDYNNYSPAVTKVDLAKVDTQYNNMLDSFAKSFENKGFLCTLFVTNADRKVSQARGIWTNIKTLLDDIHGQQFQLIDALVKVVRSRLDEVAAKSLLATGKPTIFEFMVRTIRQMLTVRVAAQQVCDTYQFLGNDVQDDETCKQLRDENIVFLSEDMRGNIKLTSGNIQKRLFSYDTDNRLACIPVTNGTNAYAINWGDFIQRQPVYFALPENETYLKENKWADFKHQAALIKSMEILIPSISEERVLLWITAIQENVRVNGNADSQRYTVKTLKPLFYETSYTLNEKPCLRQQMSNPFAPDANNEPELCLPATSGRFGNDQKLPLPVSMFSKFQIQLEEAYSDTTTEILKNLPPYGDTLKLPVRLQIRRNPGASRGPGTRRLVNCGGKYCLGQPSASCTPCPEGSVAVARGSYCVSKEVAQKVMGTARTLLN